MNRAFPTALKIPVRHQHRRILVLMPEAKDERRQQRALHSTLQDIGFTEVTLPEVESLVLDESLQVTDLTVRMSHDNSRVTVCGIDAQGNGFGHFNYPHDDVLIIR